MHFARPLMPYEAARMGIDWKYACGLKDNPHAGREFTTFRGPLVRSQVTQLRIRRRYNLGNHVRQVANAVRLAERLGVSKVLLPSGSIFGQGTAGEVQLVPMVECSRSVETELAGEFFYFQRIGFNNLSLERARVLRSLRGLVSQTSHAPELGRGDLVVHLRAGDVYSKDPHPLYGPPPLTFFQSVIEQHGPERVIFVAQSTDHPYFSPLSLFCRNLGIETSIHTSDLLTDFSVLRGAYNLCLSQGTLAMAASWLSENCSQVFAFNRENSEIDCLVSLGISVTHARSAQVRPWSGTKTQADELLQMDQSSLAWSYHEAGR